MRGGFPNFKFNWMCILKLTLKLSPWTKCDIDWRGCYNIRWKYKIWPLVNWDIWHPEQIEKIEPASNWECNKAALLFPGCLSRPLHHHLSRAASMLGTHILVGGSRVPSFSGMISFPVLYLRIPKQARVRISKDEILSLSPTRAGYWCGQVVTNI